MERTEYFNDTKPSETQLNNTEDTKINHMLTRFRTHGEFGIVQGCIVTVNAVNTKIDIGVGQAYTGGHFTNANLKGSPNSGEYINVASPITALSLADYTLGARNYVILTYSETSGTPLTDRGGLLTHDTIYTGTYTASVVTEAVWNGYTTSQKETRVLVAIVTANGAGVALTTANITQLTQPHTHPYSTQPSNITGVTIVQASNSTTIGAGTLRWVVGATNYLTWQEFGDPAPGPNCNVTSSGTYQVYSNASLSYLIVTVEYGLVSASNQTDTITVSDMYGRTIPMASAVDQAHRDMLGSGVVSPNNAHALSLNDITSGTFDHADLFHRNGIGIQSDSDNLLPYIFGTDVKITNNGGFSNSFVVDGTTYEYVTGYPGGAQPSLHFVISPPLDSGWYMIYIDEGGNPNYVLMADYNPAGGETSPLGKGANPLTNITIVDMSNFTVGTGTVDWNNTTKLLRYASPQDSAGPNYGASVLINEDTALPAYYKLYSNHTNDWIIVYVTGSLGGASSNQTFTVDMNNSDHADELILRLGSVLWKGDTSTFPTPLVDIRQKLTADNMSAFLEEHDSLGHHAVPLKDTLKVYAYDKTYGILGWGKEIGILGKGFGPTNWGVYGTGNHIGVEGRCDIANGTCIHGYGEADDGTGVLGQALGKAGTCIGVYGYATHTNGIGVYGKALCDNSATAIVASATAKFNTAIGAYINAAATAAGATGVILTASATNNVIGVYAKCQKNDPGGSQKVFLGSAEGDGAVIFEGVADTGVGLSVYAKYGATIIGRTIGAEIYGPTVGAAIVAANPGGVMAFGEKIDATAIAGIGVAYGISMAVNGGLATGLYMSIPAGLACYPFAISCSVTNTTSMSGISMLPVNVNGGIYYIPLCQYVP